MFISGLVSTDIKCKFLLDKPCHDVPLFVKEFLGNKSLQGDVLHALVWHYSV